MPSKDWLALVKTSRARNKIKHVINISERAKAIEIGVKLFEKEARRLGVSLSKVGKAELERVAGEYGYSKMEDLHAALGYGRFSARQVLQKLAPPGDRRPAARSRQSPPHPAAGSAPAPARAGRPGPQGQGSRRSAGLPCQVLQPDPRRVHRRLHHARQGRGRALEPTAPNVQNLLYEVERKIDVEWARSAAESFPVKMMVHTDDRPGVLNQLTAVLAAEQSNIRTLEASTDAGAAATAPSST